MLEQISWGEYIIAVATLIAIYYIAIALLYFRESLSGLLNGKFRTTLKQLTDPTDKVDQVQEAQTSLDKLEQVVGNIKSILDEAGTVVGKDDLLNRINSVLTNYDGLHLHAYRNAIRNYIITHALDLCGVDFREGELEAAWENLPR